MAAAGWPGRVGPAPAQGPARGAHDGGVHRDRARLHRRDRPQGRRAATRRDDRAREEPVDQPLRRRDRRAHTGRPGRAPRPRRPGRGVLDGRSLGGVGPVVGPAHAAASRARLGHARARRPARRRARRPVPRGPLRSALEPRSGGAARGPPVLRDRAHRRSSGLALRPVLVRPDGRIRGGGRGPVGPARRRRLRALRHGPDGAGGLLPQGAGRRFAQGWTTHDRLAFDAVAGDLLVELGYEPDHRWAADPMRSRVYRYQAAASAAVGKSTRWLGRQGERLSQRTPRA